MRTRATASQVVELRDRLNVAFKALRRQRLIARQAFGCCRGCAGAELGSRIVAEREQGRPLPEGAVFYTRQDAENRDSEAGLYISFGQISGYKDGAIVATTPRLTGEVGEAAATALEAAGLKVDWNRDPNTCIYVTLPALAKEAA